MASAAAWAAPSRTLARTTRYPSLASRCAMASPIPRLAPVTTATRASITRSPFTLLGERFPYHSPVAGSVGPLLRWSAAPGTGVPVHPPTPPRPPALSAEETGQEGDESGKYGQNQQGHQQDGQERPALPQVVADGALHNGTHRVHGQAHGGRQ